MNTAINTAASGALAASMRLNASASNVANARTTGPLPKGGVGASANANEAGNSGRPYTPLQTVQSSLAQDGGGSNGQTGGVRASYKPLSQPFVAEYQPDSQDANDQGLVATPNVDLMQETVQQKQGLQSYKANMAMIKAADQTQREAINMKV
ncbi:flagellar basal-body rod protein FlgC [uncultured Gammaproteobacteria bacterium]